MFILEGHLGTIRILQPLEPRAAPDAVPDRARSVHRHRAGSARARVPSRLREQRLLLRLLHQPGHAGGAVSGVRQPERRESGQRDTRALHPPAAAQSQRRLDRVRTRRRALHRDRATAAAANDDAAGHTPGIGNAQDITDNLLGKILRIDVDGDDFPLDPAKNYAIPLDEPVPERARRRRDLGLRPAQPVARELRPRDRRSVHRRRRPGVVRGDRRAAGRERGRRELRLAAARRADHDTRPRDRRAQACRARSIRSSTIRI